MQLIATGYQRAAKASRVLVGPTVLAFASWSANVSGADLPTLNFQSFDTAYNVLAGGESFDEGLYGALKCDWSCGGDWDAAANPVDDIANVPGFYIRDDLTNLTFEPNRLDVANSGVTPWFFGYARVRSAQNGGQVTGLVTFTASGINQGPFSYPIGSV